MTNSIEYDPKTPIRCIGPFQVSPAIWLSPVELSDTAEVHRILNLDKTFQEGLSSEKIVYPFPREEAEGFTAWHVNRRTENGVCDEWAVRTSVDGPLIGVFSLLDQGSHREFGPCFQGKEPVVRSPDEVVDIEKEVVLKCGKFGYWLSPEHQGKGIMTEVLRFALTKLAKQEFGFNRVHGWAWKENAGSLKVMKRTGLMRPGAGLSIYVAKYGCMKDVAQYYYEAQ